jgi:L-seryl-tRNA(Ser) seleniumtransferase
MKAVARAAQPPHFQALPSVDRLLRADGVAALVDRFGRTSVVAAARALLARERDGLAAGTSPGDSTLTGLSVRLGAELERSLASRMRRVINLTGTVIHTNLGRALLPAEAVQAVVEAMTSPGNLEYDIESGKRGDRDDIVAPILAELTGCESATVVNNNAAAVLLALNTLARGKEVVVSRGEQIEIGGGFRLPDIMARAGCKLREVGTTNRTHLEDYADAMGPRTGLVLKVHKSNYAITGFTSEVDESALGMLCRERNIPLMVDLGSGALVDLAPFGLPHEPTPRETLGRGASIVTFSGDKLLGGPQAGIVVGTSTLVARIKKNPLKRALRVSKMTLAALDAVLRLYRDPDRLEQRLTTLRMLARPVDDIDAAARRLLTTFEQAFGSRATVSVERCASQIGSGAQPVERLPSAAIVLRPTAKRGAGALLSSFERTLRELPVPVIGRIDDGALWLDLRCLVDESELVGLIAGVRP